MTQFVVWAAFDHARRECIWLPECALVINVARGGHINDQDLVQALDLGHLADACLDAFRVERLPTDHP